MAILQVIASADDDRVVRAGALAPWWSNTNPAFAAGDYDANYSSMGASARFLNVPIPQGTIIVNAYLEFRCYGSQSGTVVRTKLCMEDSDDASQIASYADHIGRARTADVDWDNIGAWVIDTDYNSPSITSLVQAVVNRPGWVSGNAMIVFWEDRDGLSDSGAYRWGQSFDGGGTPKLVILFNETTTTLRPNNAGDLTELVNEGANPNWQSVDEAVADDDTTYVEAPAIAYEPMKWDSYNLENIPGSIGSISNVRVVIRYRRIAQNPDGTYPATGSRGVRISGTSYNNDFTSASNVYLVANVDYATNPDTGVLWTVSDINNLQVLLGSDWYNMSLAQGGQMSIRHTQVYIEVTHTLRTFIPKIFIM